MTFVPSSNSTGWQPIATVSTVKNHAYGTRIRAVDPTYGEGEFIYMQGVASCVLGSAATLRYDDGATILTVADAAGPIGFAMGALVASTYGWFQIYGKAVTVAGTVSDNGDVYLTATPGSLDDAVVDGDMVHNAKFASANGTPSTGLAEIEIAYPYSDNITTND